MNHIEHFINVETRIGGREMEGCSSLEAQSTGGKG